MARAAATATGVLAVVCGAFGCLYAPIAALFVSTGAVTDLVPNYPVGYAVATFWAMSAVCLICSVMLFYCGIQISKKRFAVEIPLIALWIFELLYFYPGLSIAIQLDPLVGHVVRVANGGIAWQFVVLLPIWGIPVVVWSKRTLT